MFFTTDLGFNVFIIFFELILVLTIAMSVHKVTANKDKWNKISISANHKHWKKIKCVGT